MNGTEERDRLVVEWLPLVKAIARSIHRRVPHGVDLEDMVAAGFVGLIRAAAKYDPARDVQFKTYANHVVRGAILDSLRGLDWASRDVRQARKKVKAAIHELRELLGRTPTDAEIASHQGMTIEQFYRLMVILRPRRILSLHTRSGRVEAQDLPDADIPGKVETRPDYMSARTELRTLMGQALKTLPVRTQRLMQMYYRKEMTLKEIGAELGVNESRASQIHSGALVKMRAAFAGMGVDSSSSVLG